MVPALKLVATIIGCRGTNFAKIIKRCRGPKIIGRIITDATAHIKMITKGVDKKTPIPSLMLKHCGSMFPEYYTYAQSAASRPCTSAICIGEIGVLSWLENNYVSLKTVNNLKHWPKFLAIAPTLLRGVEDMLSIVDGEIWSQTSVGEVDETMPAEYAVNPEDLEAFQGICGESPDKFRRGRKPPVPTPSKPATPGAASPGPASAHLPSPGAAGSPGAAKERTAK